MSLTQFALVVLTSASLAIAVLVVTFGLTWTLAERAERKEKARREVEGR